ncbi:class Ib ribonucleoside-diphosphate reductase assembly flavoprotein NrdI [Kineococcus gynurae]|uniref:Protein NrdI n=1 Tax=Kineococcus gynurae TaxID=452979 RepID=A0ABV5LP28_9ACTN
MSGPGVVYFSSVSGNTHRFVEKLDDLRTLDRPPARIPLRAGEAPLKVTEPFVLITPTYAGGNGSGAVPKQVIRFLNDPANRALIVGVVGAGNTNFGDHYAAAGDIVAAKCAVPHLYRFELFGTPDDVRRVRDGLDSL